MGVVCIAIILSLTGGIQVGAVGGPVCQIGEVAYDTLAEALETVMENETIRLLQDITYEGTIVAEDKSYTIDMNGHKLDISSSIEYAIMTSNEKLDFVDSSGNENSLLTINHTQSDTSIAGGGLYAFEDGKIIIETPSKIISNTRGAKGEKNSYIELSNSSITALAGVSLSNNAEFIINGDIKGTEYDGLFAYDNVKATIKGNVEGKTKTLDLSTNCTVNIEGNISSITSYVAELDQACSLNIIGDILGEDKGVRLSKGSNLDIEGDIKAKKPLYIDASQSLQSVKIKGNLTSTSYSALEAVGDFKMDMTGNVIGVISMSNTPETSSLNIIGDISSYYGPIINHDTGSMLITGDITSRGSNDPESYAFAVASNSTFTLNGNIKSGYGVHTNAPTGLITINGNVSADTLGAYAYNGGTVIINGKLSSGYPYIKLDYVIKEEGSGVIENNYYVYSCYTNNNPNYVHTVKVKIPDIPPSTNAKLEELTGSNIILTPSFDPTIENYIASVSNDVTMTKISASKADEIQVWL